MGAIRGTAVFTLLGLSSHSAQADVTPQVVESQITEQSHRVSVSSDGGVATLVVRRHFVNQSSSNQAFQVPVLVPPHATAMSFRVRAAGRWHTGTLLRTVDELPEEHPELLQQGCHSSGEFDQVLEWSASPSAPFEMVDARWGTIASGDMAVGRIEFEVAKEISALPQKATVIFVLDASHSLGDNKLAGQLALAQGYLSHLPDAMVEFVVFRHGAKRLFGHLVAANALQQQLAKVRARLYLGNGSDLDQGLALAARIASDADEPVRIVAIGDHRMRANLEVDKIVAILGQLPANAIVHLLRFSPAVGELYEQSSVGKLAPIAHAFGGELFEIGGSTSDAAHTREVLLHLVRPVRIDDFSIDAGAELASPVSQLVEGVGFRHMTVGADMPSRIRLRGRLWSRPWTQIVDRNKILSDYLAALALNDRVAERLDEDTLTRLAFAAKAVTYRTAYLVRDAARYWINKDDFESMRGSSFG